MRVYVPVTFVGLRRASSSGALPSSGWRAHVLETDDETGEYAALQAAARESLTELRSEPEAPRRRAVVVANVPEEWTEAEPDGTVILTRRIPVERFVAVYADPEDSTAAVVAALAGKESPIEAMDLLWFARQELAELVS
ncbi:MAG: hypothetical protein U0R64_04720 [Candidatus Nanopelagicales bacterium]